MVTQIIFKDLETLEKLHNSCDIRGVLRSILIYATRENDVRFRKEIIINTFVEYTFKDGNLHILDYYKKMKNE